MPGSIGTANAVRTPIISVYAMEGFEPRPRTCSMRSQNLGLIQISLVQGSPLTVSFAVRSGAGGI